MAVCRFKGNYFWDLSLFLPSFSVASVTVGALSWFYHSSNLSVDFQLLQCLSDEHKDSCFKARGTDRWGWAWMPCWWCWSWGDAENEVAEVNPTDAHTPTKTAALQPLQVTSPAMLFLFSKTSISWSRTWGKSPVAACQPSSSCKNAERPPET